MKTEGKQNMRKKLWTTAIAMGLAALCGAAAFLGAGSVFAAERFSDVSMKQWYGKFVTELSEEGILSGYPDRTFRPEEMVSCGQFLSMALQTADRIGALPSYEVTTQVIHGHWARSFYDRAIAQELLFRDELPATSLDRPISREWMAVICSRLTPKQTASPSPKDFETVLAQINDIEELSPHSYEIVTAYTAGLLSGYQDGSFRPAGYLTRAEAASVIYQLRELWTKKDAIPGETEKKSGIFGKTDAKDTAFGKDDGKDTAFGNADAKNAASSKTDAKNAASGKTDAKDTAFGNAEKETGRKQEGAVFWEISPADFPPQTLAFYYDLKKEDGDSLEELQNEMREQTKKRGFKEAQALGEKLYQSFQGFRQRALLQGELGKQGLRKEYLCDYPVLMEALGGRIHIYVKPVGTETEYWEVTPGQVSEEFF